MFVVVEIRTQLNFSLFPADLDVFKICDVIKGSYFIQNMDKETSTVKLSYKQAPAKEN